MGKDTDRSHHHTILNMHTTIKTTISPTTTTDPVHSSLPHAPPPVPSRHTSCPHFFCLGCSNYATQTGGLASRNSFLTIVGAGNPRPRSARVAGLWCEATPGWMAECTPSSRDVRNRGPRVSIPRGVHQFKSHLITFQSPHTPTSAWG